MINSNFHTSTGQRNFDCLLVNIFDDLSGELIQTVQSATHQILDITSNFLEADVSHAIKDFHSLYEKNVELDSYKESISKNIDDIIHYVQEQGGDVDKINAPDLSDIDTEQLEASRLSLSTMQKDMEALARLDEGMKERVLPILHSMQFEDQLSANVLIITRAWKIFIDKADGNNSSAAAVLEDVYSNLSSEKLRELFCHHVLNRKVIFKNKIPPEVIDTVVESLEGEEELFDRMQIFCSKVLKWSTDDSASSVDLVFDLISTLEHEASDAGDFSDETHDAFQSLKDIANGFGNPAKRESTRIMISLLQNRVNLNESVQALIKPVMVAMQFQDRIRQNMENLSKTMELWLESRKELATTTGDLPDSVRTKVGVDLMNFMTMESERDIVKKHVPGDYEPLYDGSDDSELF